MKKSWKKTKRKEIGRIVSVPRSQNGRYCFEDKCDLEESQVAMNDEYIEDGAHLFSRLEQVAQEISF